MRKSQALIVFGFLGGLGIALACVVAFGVLPAPVEAVLPIAYVVVVVFLVRQYFGTSRPAVRGKASDFVKALVCVVASIIWAAVAASLTGDTVLGHWIIGAPSLLMSAIGSFFFARAFYDRIRLCGMSINVSVSRQRLWVINGHIWEGRIREYSEATFEPVTLMTQK